MKEKNAFSLAEMIIALGVISILMAIVTPILMSSKPEKQIILTRKAYSTVSTVVNELANDYNLYPDDELVFGYTDDSISKDDTVKRFCDNINEKINSSDYSFASGECSLTTYDGIEWTISPKFYQAGTLIKDEDKTDSKEYSSHFIVSIPNGKTFTIYMRYDGKLAVKDTDVIEILKDSDKIK